MVRKTDYGYNLTDGFGVDNQTVSHYDPEAHKFLIHLDFIREEWITTQQLKKALKRFNLSESEATNLVKEMKATLRTKVSYY